MSACATAPSPPSSGGGGALVGSEWRLEDLLGGGIIDRSHLTLTLAKDGSAAGSGGCNRYFGTWTQTGDKLTIGKMGSTMMACAPSLMEQEGKYLKALESASAYSFTADGALLIATAAGPLKFRKD
ncbi:MAG: META domain-containing protein [Phenylobacterium sp.]|uniref:META domain-containing protein n=1 Tax=Phenylobacterium sp. TaxID=1871053 RepID=UPI0025CE360C|nr:META domain-containing protein [Phenylobacterium sp.]MBA4013127.1 META domain-containing protein [Phenylobacterium sp.]